MAQKVDYAALKKGGYMRQKQKGYGSLRLAVRFPPTTASLREP